MTSMQASETEMRQQLAKFTSALASFSSSSDKFRVLSTVPKIAAGSSFPPRTPIKTLYILDSSFNPPTRAHLKIVLNALLEDCGPHPKHLLLLLAIQNADKAPKPAPFEHRLTLMDIFASDIEKECRSIISEIPGYREHIDTQKIPRIDIGVTKEPYFIDKAAAITSSGIYKNNPEQVHLIGYDTIVRLFNPKYYPPQHTLAPLEPFLQAHRLRMTYRPDADWGDPKAQEDFVKGIREGTLEEKGGKRAWADRIELVDGRKVGEEIVSSTKVREAVRKGDREALKMLVTEGVVDWILQEELYTKED